MDSASSEARAGSEPLGRPLLEKDSPFLSGAFSSAGTEPALRVAELAAESPFAQEDAVVLEQMLPHVAPTPMPATAAVRRFELQFVDGDGRPISDARWAVHQDGAVFEGSTNARGGTGLIDATMRRFDAARSFRVHVDGRVCSIVSGAALQTSDPGVEYGGQFVDWSLAADGKQKVRDAFWKEYGKARKELSGREVFRFLQHDHVMRRPVKFLSGVTEAVFAAVPIGIRLGPMVRYADAGRALIWMELETPALVRVQYGSARAQEDLPRQGDEPIARQVRHGSTVRVGGRHYALVCLDGLQPDTAYQYTVELGPLPPIGKIPVAPGDFTEAVLPRELPLSVRHANAAAVANSSFRHTRWLFFRSLPATSEALRFAHGSCRKWPGDHDEKGNVPGPDMLESFGRSWLLARKWSEWPQFFVHTGDQIYADDIGVGLGAVILRHRFAAQVPGPAQTAADDVAFGAWAGRFGVRYLQLEAPGLAPRTDFDELKKMRAQVAGHERHDLDFQLREAARARSQVGRYRNRQPLLEDERLTGMKRHMRNRLRVLNGLLWHVPDVASQVPIVHKREGLLAPYRYQRPRWSQHSWQLEHPAAGETGGVHAADYSEYAALYEQAWSTLHTRKVMAHLPSFMIFDDHEVTDDWNADRGWLQVIHSKRDPFHCWPMTMTDALASYWLYQGWGNLAPEKWGNDARVQILERCRREGRDALPELRRLIHSRAIAPTAGGEYASRKLDWNYALPTRGIPFLVVDLRTDRDVNGNGRMSLARERWIERELMATKSPMAFLVMPVPVLLPDPLLFAFRNPSLTGLLAGARSTVAFKRSSDLEHPAGNEVWDQLKELLKRLQRSSTLKTIVFVSGDIHFACNLDGQLADSARTPRLLQLISSGLQQKICKAKQDKLREAYRGWLNMISRAQGVDQHRGLRITVGGMKSADDKRRNFLHSTSIAIVDAKYGTQMFAGRKVAVPLIVQMHFTADQNGKLVAHTFQHITRPDGAAFMTLNDPGFAHPTSPKDYPATDPSGIGVARELEQDGDDRELRTMADGRASAH